MTYPRRMKLTRSWASVGLLACVGACSGSKATGGTTGQGGGASASVSGSTAAATTGAGTGGAANGDQYGPWAGGSTYYAAWANGPSSDPSFFPITVWLQSPANAPAYQAIGINMFIGLYQGPTDQDLTTLDSAKMPVACDQNAVGLAHVSDKTIAAWTQQDEPDNAQPAAGGGYGPCVPASTIQSLYQQMKMGDPSRPIFLNLGQGVAHDYIGWGSECAMTHPADYPDYVKGADIVSFDIYPMNETSAPVAGHPEYVAMGVDNLVKWSNGKKPVWNWIECTGISDPSGKPTPAIVKAEVWMSIVHGSMGIGYFVHQFSPTFDEHALLDDPTMKAAVAAINQQIHDLAPALNTPPITNGGKVSSSMAAVPVDMVLKRQGGATYVFAVAMAGATTHATFSALTNLQGATTVEVIGESRSLPIANASFEDDFDAYGVHLYKIH